MNWNAAALISHEGREAARGAEPQSRRPQVPECAAPLEWIKSLVELFKTDVRELSLVRLSLFLLWGAELPSRWEIIGGGVRPRSRDLVAQAADRQNDRAITSCL